MESESPNRGRTDETVRRVESGPDGPRTEWVGADELRRGDRILVRPGERVGVDGTVVETRSEEREDAEAAVETPEGKRRTVRAGTAVDADETVLDATVVVEVDKRALLPWIGAALGGGTAGLRVVLVALAVVVAFAGSGLGIYGSVTEYATQSGERVADALGIGNRDAADRAPPAPDVEVEAPNASDSGGATSDPPDSDGGDGEDEAVETTAPETEAETTTAPETATTSEAETATRTTAAGGRDQSGGGGGDDNDDEPVSVSPDLTLGEVDPDPIRTADGTVGDVRATVGGELSWSGQANVVLVVQTWVPGGGWKEVRRTTVTGASPVSLADALGEVTYASGERAAAFGSPDAGETERTTGRVAVTAVFFDGGEEVERTTEEATFEVAVTNDAVDLRLGDDGGNVSVIDFADGGSGDGSAGSDDGTVVPGSTGSNTVPLRNDGVRPGVVRLETVSSVSYENGLTGPESAVDATGGDPGAGAGELDGAVEIRAKAVFADGTSRYVVGSEDAYRSVASLEDASLPVGELAPGESLDLVVDFRVPESAGNEIQSDTIVVDFEFTLTEST